MGIIWRSAMPLLTTLAALVIIVHSAEEDLETEYRHDLRPRILDTGTPSYDRPWRAMEEDHPVQQRHAENWDNESPDDLPKRRKTGRKRKRRPQTSSTEDLVVQERHVYPDEPPRPYFDVEFENTHQTTEITRRRRKKPESRPIRWADDVVDVDLERPIRKKGQRRKRPSLDTWPDLSEFRQPASNIHEQTESKTEVVDPVNIDDIREEPAQEDVTQLYGKEQELGEQKPSNIEVEINQRATKEEIPLPLGNNGEDNLEHENVQLVEDKSLSEFSSEIMLAAPRPTKRSNIQKLRDNKSFNKVQDKCLSDCDDKGIGIFLSLILNNRLEIYDRYLPYWYKLEQQKANEKVEEKFDVDTLKEQTKRRHKILSSKCKDKLQHYSNPTLQEFQRVLWRKGLDMDTYLMDPLTLKDILKRSNGTSLSEILQQHNLSLTDLLHGKQHAVSIFKSQDSLELQNRNPVEQRNDLSQIRPNIQDKDESEEQSLKYVETKYSTEPATEYPVQDEIQTEANKKDEDEPATTVKPLEEKTPKISTRRRFPLGARNKLRMRPMLNNTYKGQLSRDLIALNARKYSYHRRNFTKSRMDAAPPLMPNNTHNIDKNTNEPETTTTTIAQEETTITIEVPYNNSSSEELNPEDDQNSKLDDINMDGTEIIPTELPTEIPKPATEKPTIISIPRPTVNSTGLRRQAFNNRLKKKRLKHKNATTEPPQDDLIKHLFGLGNLVSSSEFIARTQEPKFTEDDSRDTTLDDFITTESLFKQSKTIIKASISTTPIPITTEETAKVEIEEILNDTRASAKLSKILMERNMTLSELVEHRERGSSHVHLADIFHNASREPNPPEPFLSKSLLEPISKETYPLRALLDANLHDPNTRATTVDPSMVDNVNVPIAMDFRNNVNENAENMGIMSLFNNFTKPANITTSLQDSEGRAYKSSVVAINITNSNNASETVRESRVLSESQDDVVSWNEIFSLMGRNHNNDTSANALEVSGLALKPFKKIRLDEDADGDGLIVLEDLQHLKDFDSNVASGSDEKVEVNAYENKEQTEKGSGILDKIPSQTKSVTVATASIAGLAMILFLLTYVAFKWKQQRSVIRKKRSFRDERIPTPVFEHRKGHKNNNSTRSISPMLQTSNIYTLNTLDSQNGKDSPDYMWDTLRKPFQ